MRPRRHSRRSIPSRPAIFTAILGLALLLGLGNRIGLLDRPPAVTSPAGFDANLLEIDAALPARPNYNFSVIPGGAFTGQELEGAVNHDAVVAEHYRDVDTSTMRPEILKADRLAYVSYRLGNHVYWTSKKVRIRSGETILTNGQTQIRARCGNCISMEPLMPTSADEPDPMQLDALSDIGPLQLEALMDTSPVLMAWPLNPLAPLPPGDPGDVELAAPLATPQFGLPLFPLPGGFPGDGPVDPEVAGPLPVVADADPGVDATLPSGAVPPGGAVPPAEAVTPLGALPPGGVVPPTTAGPRVPESPNDDPFPPGPPDGPTTRVTPPPPPDATPIPEPATMLLLGGGIAGMIARRWSSTRA